MKIKAESLEFVRDVLKDVMKIGIKGYYLDSLEFEYGFNFKLNFKEIKKDTKE